MKKGSGTKKSMNISIDIDLWEWLDGYHKKGIVDKSKTVNLCLRRLQHAVETEGAHKFYELPESKDTNSGGLIIEAPE